MKISTFFYVRGIYSVISEVLYEVEDGVVEDVGDDVAVALFFSFAVVGV